METRCSSAQRTFPLNKQKYRKPACRFFLGQKKKISGGHWTLFFREAGSCEYWGLKVCWG